MAKLRAAGRLALYPWLVLGTYFGADYDLLEDRSYYSSEGYTEPFIFEPITE